MNRWTIVGILFCGLTLLFGPTLSADPVLPPWVSEDIGATLPGSADFNPGPGEYTVVGDGGDIWGNADAFHFLHQLQAGDFTAAVRVVSQQNTNGWAKAGIMARADTTPGAVHVHTSATPSNGIGQQWRDSADGGSAWPGVRIGGSPDSGSAPFWLYLARVGNNFYSRWAPDNAGTPGMWSPPQAHSSPNMPATVELGMSVTSHDGGTTSAAVFDNVNLGYTLTSDPFPAGVVSQDIGGPAIPGTAEYYSATGTYVLSGGGADIWGTSDQFQYVHQLQTGDFTAVARLVSQANTDGWAKAGIMAREDTSAGSRHVNVSATPGNQVKMQGRPTTAGSDSGQFNNTVPGSPNSDQAPYFLMLRRQGNEFVARYAQDDGSGQPAYFGVPQRYTIGDMAASLEVGLHVTSHDNSEVSGVVFDNVNLTNYQADPLPPPFSSADIGPNVGTDPRVGSTEYYANTGTIVVEGGGADIWGSADAFRFVSAPASFLGITGDFTATARLIAQENSNGWAKAGIMARTDLTPGSQFAGVFGTPGNGVGLQWRDSADGGAGWPGARIDGSPNGTEDGSAPIWLSLQRRGDTFVAYWAPDESGSPGQWTSSGHSIAGMPADINLGLAVTAHDAPDLSMAIFDNIDVQAGAPLFGDPLPSIDTSLTGISTHVVHYTGGYGDIAGAMDRLNLRPGDAGHLVSQVTTLPTVNLETHGEGGTEGFPAGPLLAANESGDPTPPLDWAGRMTGYIEAQAGQTMSFLVRHDDDVQMTVGETVVAELPGWDGGSPVTFDVTFDRGGYWPIEVIWRQGGGGLGLKLASRTSPADPWVLVGDTAAGGLPVYQQPGSVPAPSEAGANPAGSALLAGPVDTAAADGARIQVLTDPSIGDIDGAIGVLLANPNAGSITKGSVLDFHGSGGTGNFQVDLPFPQDPGFTGSNIGMRINGLLYVDQPGDYAFGVNTDDGFQLRVGQNVLGRFPGGRGMASVPNVGYAHFDEAGLYPLEYYFYQGGGGYGSEVSMAPSPGVVLGTRDPVALGFSPDFQGKLFSVEPVARLSRAYTELRGAAYADVPALGMQIAPEHWILEEHITGPQPGLVGTYYTRNSDWTPGTLLGTRNDLVPAGTGYFGGDSPAQTSFNFPDNFGYGPWGNQEDDFYVEWTGILTIPAGEGGTYTFAEHVDDRSRLFIDDMSTPILSDDTWDNYATTSIDLTPGEHLFKYIAIEAGGGEFADLLWLPPGSSGDPNDPASWDYVGADVFSFDADLWVTLAEGTDAFGSPTMDALLTEFEMGSFHELRLTTEVAGLTAVAELSARFVPEPASYLLLTLGGLGLLFWRRKRPG